MNPAEDLEDTINHLRMFGYRIGILTDSALQSPAIREILSSISYRIHTIVSSRDVGKMKPNSLMYDTILRKMNIPANKALFVGHDSEELIGAKEAGMYHENFENYGSLTRLLQVIQTKYVFSEKKKDESRF